jgi:hypothetical protein
MKWFTIPKLLPVSNPEISLHTFKFRRAGLPFCISFGEFFFSPFTVFYFYSPIFINQVYFMELLQPSMDASRRLQIIYYTGCGPLELYVGFEMMQPTRGLSQTPRPRKTTPPSICRHHLANVCHMQEECKELHTIQKVSMSIMDTFNVDCFCAKCFKINGTRRSLLQCMCAFHISMRS